MQFSHALIALVVAGLANAQGLPNLPPCSLNCFVSALGNDGCTPLTNFACHCKVPGLPDKITPCVKGACNIADQSSVSSIVISECSAANHRITLPPVEGSTTASSPSSEATETGLSTATSVPIETGSTSATGSESVSTSESASGSTSGSASGTGSVTGSGSTIPTGGSSSIPAGSSSAVPTGGSGGSGSVAPTGSSSPTETSSVSVFPGAAPTIKSNVAGLVAVAAAAVYAL